MEKTALKTKVYEAALKAQANIVEDFSQRIAELTETDQDTANEQHDSGAQSMSAETDAQIAMLNEQLSMVKEEFEKLNRIDPAVIAENAHLGALVMTNSMRFFVSVSIERFKSEGVEYFGISTQSPVYKAMEGKKAGETFEVNGNKFEILEVI